MALHLTGQACHPSVDQGTPTATERYVPLRVGLTIAGATGNDGTVGLLVRPSRAAHPVHHDQLGQPAPPARRRDYTLMAPSDTGVSPVSL